jgi:glycosyltransferase involved in cell wall biosynthesis
MPRFSVVIPTYNAAGTIGATLRSVLAQSEPDFELIVVDDGSSDETPRLVHEFASDPRLIEIRQDNQGTAGARNTGIATARAAYVSFLDNDDLWMPDYLAEMGAALDAHPDAGFAYCDAWALDDSTLRIGRITEMEVRPAPAPRADLEQIFLVLGRGNFVQSSATVRRDALEATGGFATEIRGTDDYDLWFRILLSGRRAVRAGDRPLMLQRGRHDSQSKDELMMVESLRRVLVRVVEDPRTPETAREQISRRIKAVDRELAMVAGINPAARALLRLRSAAVRLRNLARRDGAWLSEPPADVAAAFPELARRSP